ncbi:MAG: transporter ATP-binding protein [Verrucomicrobiaceae bacterium]|nr:transporter ATP-binding protein [Verrucomicrobiaceae bacterium]
MSGELSIDNLSLYLGSGSQRFTALENVSLNVAAGEFVCILGPSGCGKSTLLGAVAGHLAPSRGSMTLDKKTITTPHPQRGLVFQHHTLFPWQTVIDNVAFGLKMKSIKRDERRSRARDLLKLVGLEDSADLYPSQLSGGMQQRVEIARVLVNHPDVLLMDEPFGALDAITRLRMQELLLDIWTRIRTTILFVTHDIDEALFLADRIVMMSARPGTIIEEIVLEFPRPRSASLLTSPRFAELKRYCLSLLHDDHADVGRLSPLGDLPTYTAVPVLQLAI